MPGKMKEIETDEHVVEIAMKRLKSFQDHPSRITTDQQMINLNYS